MDSWYTLARIPLADHILCRAGALWSPSTDVIACVDWPSTLRWALDYYIYAMHLVRAQKHVAAAMAIRLYLERWTHHLAYCQEIARDEGETEAAFFTRAWSVYGGLAQEHDMGQYWRWLSEYLHGRPELRRAWASHPKYSSSTAADYAHVGEQMATIASTAFFQPLSAIGAYAFDNGLEDLASKLFKYPLAPKTHDTWAEDLLTSQSLYALDMVYLATDAAAKLSSEGTQYRWFVSERSNTAALKSLSLGHAQMAYIERRGRAIDRASAAFRQEFEAFGDAFDPKYLHAKLFRYIGITEMARLCGGGDLAAPERQALHIAADALEAAWFVWLEDTDLSLGCVRVLIEQTARARAHRLKTSRAQRLEALAVAPAPFRWLELAGLKRLSSYNVALGHFSHIRLNSRMSGARRLLEEMQSEPNEHAAHTARGDVLDEAAYVLAHEVLARLDLLDPKLAQSLREAVTLHDAENHEARLAEMLERSTARRGGDLGTADFVMQSHDDEIP